MHRYVVGRNEQKQVVIEGEGSYVVELAEEGARAEILGAFDLSGEEKKKIKIKIIHMAENTSADTLLKAVVHDSANIDIRGKIIVQKGAQQTESFLQERVLLLSDKASATAIPDLEIEANDVKCSHAAAVSNINEEEIFYMMSRGIERKEATKMITDGYLKEVWDKISSDGGEND